MKSFTSLTIQSKSWTKRRFKSLGLVALGSSALVLLFQNFSSSQDTRVCSSSKIKSIVENAKSSGQE